MTIENTGSLGADGIFLTFWQSDETLVGQSNSNFSYGYDVMIDNSLNDEDQFFRLIDIDTLTEPITDIQMVKNVEVLEALDEDSIGTMLQITSTRGSATFEDISALKATKLRIVDEVLFATGTPGPNQGVFGEIEAAENSFTQTGEKVPEPATILGLFVVGGLSLGLKCKKKL